MTQTGSAARRLVAALADTTPAFGGGQPTDTAPGPLPSNVDTPRLVELLERKAAADLDMVKTARALAAELRREAGMPEADPVDADDSHATLRHGTSVRVRLTLSDGRTATVRGTVVALSSTPPPRVVDVGLYDGTVTFGPRTP